MARRGTSAVRSVAERSAPSSMAGTDKPSLMRPNTFHPANSLRDLLPRDKKLSPPEVADLGKSERDHAAAELLNTERRYGFDLMVFMTSFGTAAACGLTVCIQRNGTSPDSATAYLAISFSMHQRLYGGD